jgi:hypothetical protein
MAEELRKSRIAKLSHEKASKTKCKTNYMKFSKALRQKIFVKLIMAAKLVRPLVIQKKQEIADEKRREHLRMLHQQKQQEEELRRQREIHLRKMLMKKRREIFANVLKDINRGEIAKSGEKKRVKRAFFQWLTKAKILKEAA